MSQSSRRHTNGARSRWRLPFVPTFLIGLLLVPASAVASNLLVRSTPAAETAPAIATADQALFRQVDSAAGETVPSPAPPRTPDSGADVATACGPEGLALVDKENANTISDVEKAALEALRGICDKAGMALPGSPQPVAQTLTLASGGATAFEAEYDAYVAAYSAAEAAVNNAIAAGGNSTLINQAIDMLAEAQQAAQQGDFVTGLNWAVAAAPTADQALVTGSGGEDDDSQEEGGDDDSSGEHDD